MGLIGLLLLLSGFITGCDNSGKQAQMGRNGYEVGAQKGEFQAEAFLPLPPDANLRAVAMKFPFIADWPEQTQEAFARGFVVGFKERYEAVKRKKIENGSSPHSWRPRSQF